MVTISLNRAFIINADRSPDESINSGFSWVAKADETFVNTLDLLYTFVEKLPLIRKQVVPETACDCEGWDMGPHGTFDIFQFLVHSLRHTWAFDLVVLGSAVFNTRGSHGLCLGDVLQSKEYPILTCDPRTDQAVLWKFHGVRFGKPICLQLMALLDSWHNGRRGRPSLLKLIQRYGGAWMGEEELELTIEEMRRGKEFFKGRDEEHNSRYKAFHDRPLTTQAMQYAFGDIAQMPMLFNAIFGGGPLRVNQSARDYIVQSSRRACEFGMSSHFRSGRNNGASPQFFASLDAVIDVSNLTFPVPATTRRKKNRIAWPKPIAIELDAKLDSGGLPREPEPWVEEYLWLI